MAEVILQFPDIWAMTPLPWQILPWQNMMLQIQSQGHARTVHVVNRFLQPFDARFEYSLQGEDLCCLIRFEHEQGHTAWWLTYG
jgi:hypothetical protein